MKLVTPFYSNLNLKNIRDVDIVSTYKDKSSDILIKSLELIYSKEGFSLTNLNSFKLNVEKLINGETPNLENIYNFPILKYSFQHLKNFYEEGRIDSEDLNNIISRLENFKLPINITQTHPSTPFFKTNKDYKSIKNFRTPKIKELIDYGKGLENIKFQIEKGIKGEKLNLTDIQNFKSHLLRIINYDNSGYGEMYNTPILFYSLNHIEELFKLGKYNVKEIEDFILHLNFPPPISLPPLPTQNILQTYKNYKSYV